MYHLNKICHLIINRNQEVVSVVPLIVRNIHDWTVHRIWLVLDHLLAALGRCTAGRLLSRLLISNLCYWRTIIIIIVILMLIIIIIIMLIVMLIVILILTVRAILITIVVTIVIAIVIIIIIIIMCYIVI